MYEFEILSIPKAEPFNSYQQLWLLAERNAILSIKRSDSRISKTLKLKIPDSLFEKKKKLN